MDIGIAKALLAAFHGEYGQNATLRLRDTEDDRTYHIEIAGTAIKCAVASGVDHQAADLFAHAPELAAAFVRVSAERDRLARILAVERGDESQAPEGWVCGVDDWDVLGSDGHSIRRVERDGLGQPWLWTVFAADEDRILDEGEALHALEAMEAADAALAAVSGEETPDKPDAPA